MSSSNHRKKVDSLSSRLWACLPTAWNVDIGEGIAVLLWVPDQRALDQGAAQDRSVWGGCLTGDERRIPKAAE